MKSFWIIVVLCVMALSGCREEVQMLDVQQEQVTMESDEGQISMTYPVFLSSDERIQKRCALLNTEVQQFLSGLQDSLQTQVREMFLSLQESGLGVPAWKYALFVRDSVFQATSEYVSLRLSVYTYAGGAHGATAYYAFNFDVRKQKFLKAEDIVSSRNPELLNGLLKDHFQNPQGCFHTDPTIDLATVINFTPEEVCFTYAQYLLGPYSCGAAEVTIPRPALQSLFLLSPW